MYLSKNPSSPLNETKYHIYTNSFMYNSFYITKNDKTNVYSCGRNDHTQCLRRETSKNDLKENFLKSREMNLGIADMLHVSKLNSVEGTKVLKISSGWAHFIMLTDAHKCYSHGYNCYGQLTVKNKDVNERWSFIKCLEKYKVIDIFSGNLHNIFITQNRGLFSSGYNEDRQLGAGTNAKFSDYALKVKLSNPIETVFCGGMFTLFFTKFRKLYLSGTTFNKRTRNYPTLISTSHILGRITRVACGSTYFHILSSTGKLYGMGKSNYGSHGLSNNTFIGESSKFNDVVDVKSGYDFTLLLRRSGDVYGFGKSYEGELGTTKSTVYRDYYNDDFNAKEKPILVKKNICEIFAGRMHTFMVARDEKIYVCGYNSYGGLGISGSLVKEKVMEMKEILKFGGVARTNYGVKKVVSFRKKMFLCSKYYDVFIITC